MERTVRVTAVLAIAVTLVFVPATATAALIPAPGTGHGVIGATTPAEEGASLKVTPGVGGAAEAACLASPLVEAQRTLEQVGGILPIRLCIGQFPTPKVQVTITTPRGPTHLLRGAVRRETDWASPSRLPSLRVRRPRAIG